jgi:hypothetical protein
MYARVMQNLLGLLLDNGRMNLNLDDDIFKGMTITRNGEVIQEQTRKAMNLDAAPAPAPAPVEASPQPEEPAANEEAAPATEPGEGAPAESASDTDGTNRSS